MNILSSADIRKDLREVLISKYGNLTFQFYSDISEADKNLPEADVLITYGEDLTARHIEKAVKLKWIMVISAGLDEMPFEAIGKRNILVTNARGIHRTPMAEYTMAMMLQAARQTKRLIENEQQGTWERTLAMTELCGTTICVLGTGAIGQEIARLAKAFGMKTSGINRTGRKVEYFDRVEPCDNLDVLLTEADFVVSVLPKTKATDRMLAKKQFHLMKQNAVLINIGRGNVIDDEELIGALTEGSIAHAVLDVFNEEPLPKEHPYWRMKNVTVTPHLSGRSPEYQPRALEIFERNLKVFLQGKENYINRIDPDKGY
ncbi:Phosphoglycerate dehydrogenase [Evansella caseinilytica]|uniref:Phosphoglycerate dehydrogenase n=1 Tax=Evansella caseinilytica TaxID=1503961 RepID=A0A1H3J4M8_9BACI|nr:D-2-hydroxyacid dehydrogenase [Evansella caseinilytica]SDY34886.1 Phosphoglycerate dehydrogenase [Evansella caseinilytica]